MAAKNGARSPSGAGGRTVEAVHREKAASLAPLGKRAGRGVERRKGDFMGKRIVIMRGGTAEYTVQRSRFIANTAAVKDEEAAQAFLQAVKKVQYDARHHCYGWTFAGGLRKKSSDDGEPSGTAGKPILGRINSNELTDILIIVVRYYGGINLGTSGLISAYRQAATDAIAHAEIKTEMVEELVDFSFSYAMMNSVMRVVSEFSPRIVSQTFDNTCTISLAIPRSQAARLRDRLSKLSFE